MSIFSRVAQAVVVSLFAVALTVGFPTYLELPVIDVFADDDHISLEVVTGKDINEYWVTYDTEVPENAQSVTVWTYEPDDVTSYVIYSFN